MYNHVPFNTLLGKTLIDVKETGREIIFITENEQYILFHDQECCEHVSIEDICGELTDLIGEPILLAEEVTSFENPKLAPDESFQWTFYKLSTRKANVTIRWYGESNGYYSTSVDFVQVDKYT